MHITVLGATGKTGSTIVDQALDQGHHVTALVRDASKITRTHPALIVLTGDARETADLTKALADADAVISALGTSSAKDGLIARSTAALVRAARDTAVRRIIVMSSFMASEQYQPNLMGRLVGAMMKGVVADKTAGERFLTASDLSWTLVYPTGLDKSPAGSLVRVVPPTETVSLSNGIARVDVARFLLGELTDDAHLRQKVVITSK